MKHAYLWAMVAKEFGVPLATQRELNIMFGFSDQEYEQLNELADEVVSALKSGQYRASLVPKTL